MPGVWRDGVRPQYALVDALNEEWADLVISCGELVAGWGHRHSALGDCQDVADVLVAIRGDPDAVLRALLTETAGGCRTSARVVLQTLLGKLVRMAGRGRPEAIDDYVAAAWCRIVSYPLSRRPDHIVGNLVLDTLKDVRRPRSTLVPLAWPPPDEFVDLPIQRLDRAMWIERAWRDADGPSVHDLIGTAVDLQVISAPLGEVMVSVYVDGLSTALAARRHAVSPEVVRYRCSQARRRMKRQAAQILTAA